MKIAIFYCLDFGGAKRVVMEHAKGLKNKGHVVDVYTVNAESDAFDPSLFSNNAYTYSFDPSSSVPLVSRFFIDYKNFFTLKSLHKKIAYDIDKHKYDIVLVHPDIYTQAPFLLRFLKTPSVYYCQEPLRIVYEYSMRLRVQINIIKRCYEELTRLYRKRIDRDNVLASTFTIASCYHVRERMIEAYYVFPKVVYCGVDDKIFHPLHIKKKNQVFFVGSPNVIEDGYDLVKQALEKIPNRIRPKVYIVSWQKDNGERLTEKELVNIYNESFVTLSTSRLETFGLVPLESMACGTPVIATKISGHRETVLDGETGFLVDFDPQEIADKIIKLLQDQKLTSKLGKNAREYIKKAWNWEKCINDIDVVLKNFANKK
jgi:glycosyltransferase involved in cell wall biosynthesis